MKVIITGASGLLGRAVLGKFIKAQDEGIRTVGTCLTRPGHGLVKTDLTRQEDVEQLIADHSPDLVIHSAAVRTPDTCENDHETTTRINVDATGFLARACHQSGASMIFMSTDYVFPGDNPPYTPESQPRPLNFYGRSKLMGEVEAARAGCPLAVLRVPVLYGPVMELGESAVTDVARSLLPPLSARRLDNWAIRFPTHVDDVADVLLGLTRMKLRDGAIPEGIFQWSGNQPMTKYQMAVSMAKSLGLDHSHIAPDNDPPKGPPRPQNTMMDISAIRNFGIDPQTDFHAAIGRAIAPFFEIQAKD